MVLQPSLALPGLGCNVPPPSKIDLLPPEIREELDRKLITNAFSGFVALSDWLASLGYFIGKSAIGVRSQQLERRINASRAAVQAAEALEEATRDDAGALSNAIYAQFQVGIQDALLSCVEAGEEEDPKKRLALLTRAGKDFAAIGRGNIAGRKHMADVREKLTAAREEVRKLAEGAGVSEETLAAIDRRLQGVV